MTYHILANAGCGLPWMEERKIIDVLRMPTQSILAELAVVMPPSEPSDPSSPAKS